MPKPPETCRLFFALWPEPAVAEQIRRAVAGSLAGCDGKRLAVGHLHITLVFYGRAGAGELACLQQAAGAIRGQPFQLRLERLGHWPKPRVTWLAPAVVPAALIALQSDLSQSLVDNCGYQAEKRSYRPHMTLTRKSKRAPMLAEPEPIQWQVRQFALVSSITHPEGAEYKVLKQWPLVD